MEGVEQTEKGTILRVQVSPRAAANKVLGVHDGMIKVALTAPPVEGAANKALVELLSKALDVPKSAIILTAGVSSRRKTLLIDGITPEAVSRRLGISLLTPDP